MTQPSFVPIPDADQVRPARRLQAATSWTPQRPGDFRRPAMPTGRGFGRPGPDQGFALRVARAFADRVQLREGEDLEDVLFGCALLASMRAGAFGRAPSAPDIKWAMNLFGFLEADPPDDLVKARSEGFKSLGHDYALQRALVDRIPPETLRLSPDQVVARRTEWKALIGG